jgi:spore coat polysaccharide biosynthesis predicted glycosyltransferase SpsG
MATHQPDVVVAADAGIRSGLGHLSRSGAVAAALRAQELHVDCFALQAAACVRHDSITWQPAASVDEVTPPRPGGLVILDSYSATPAAVHAKLRPASLAVMHPRNLDAHVDVVVSPIPEQRPVAASVVLSGLEHACLRPAFWGLRPPPPLEELPLQVLLTVGGGVHKQTKDVIEAIVALKRDIRLSVVGGDASRSTWENVSVVAFAPSLLPAMLRADIVVSASGQTALESLAAGRASVIFVVAENQIRQADYLAELGLVKHARNPEHVAQEVAQLFDEPELRQQLAHGGPVAVDGFGALRVAARLASLLRR